LKANIIALRLVFRGCRVKVTIVLSDNIIKTIVLEEGGIELDGVEIVPVSIKGDTIVYNADSF
jgi:hypothetical protein